MKNIDRLISLIKKTGDRCVVVDQDGEPVFVLSSFDEYERLVMGSGDPRHLTEDQLLEKINRDVATWKSSQEQDVATLGNWQAVGDILKAGAAAPIESQENQQKEPKSTPPTKADDTYYFEPIE